MRKNIKLGVGLLTVLATPIVINTVDGNEVQAAQGWVRSGSTWYHYKTNGSLTRNAWVGNYWLGADGRMVTNSWVDNNNYYVGSNGAWEKDAKKPEEKKSGWIQSGSTWYYYNAQGQMVRNAWVGNYWLGADGRMVINSWVDNNNYYVGSNGAWVKDAKKPEEKKSGWIQSGSTWYYYNAQPLNMPQYYQGDSRWGSKRYGISTMRNAGCVPTSLAMAFSGLGKQVKPTDVADVIYYNTNEFNKREIGTSGRGAAYAIRHYGFNYSVIQSKEQLIQALQSGRPVFAAMGNGYFVKGNYYTHAVILSGYQNEKTKAMDPDNAYTTGKWYDVNNIWNQRSLEPSDTVMGGSFMMIGNN